MSASFAGSSGDVDDLIRGLLGDIAHRMDGLRISHVVGIFLGQLTIGIATPAAEIAVIDKSTSHIVIR